MYLSLSCQINSDALMLNLNWCNRRLPAGFVNVHSECATIRHPQHPLPRRLNLARAYWYLVIRQTDHNIAVMPSVSNTTGQEFNPRSLFNVLGSISCVFPLLLKHRGNLLPSSPQTLTNVKQVAKRRARSWRWRRQVPPKCRLTFNGLYGVIF
jgi:hypothetical protein